MGAPRERNRPVKVAGYLPDQLADVVVVVVTGDHDAVGGPVLVQHPKQRAAQPAGRVRRDDDMCLSRGSLPLGVAHSHTFHGAEPSCHA